MAAWTDMITLPAWLIFVPALLPLVVSLIFYVKIRRLKNRAKRKAQSQQAQNLLMSMRLTRDIMVAARDNLDQQEAFIRGLVQLLNKLEHP